jgi:cell division protein FtsI/penicillin-binding protein 2
MSVVIMDIATGEVRAIAEPHRTTSGAPLLSFEPLLMGSVVKPLIASAILARQPELGELRVEYSPGTVTEVGGVRLTVPFDNPANGCGGTIDFEDFLRCSSNQFAAELVVRSLQRDGFRATHDGAVVPREVLERSAIGNGLAKVFDADAFGHRTEGRNPHYWSPSCAPRAGESAATTNLALVPWENRPWLLFPASPGTRIDLLARYGFGGWENRWTLVGVAQAFARIATGREVHASFMRCAPVAAGAQRFAEVSPEVKRAFGRVRGGLSQVGSSGTASGLTGRLRTALGPNLTVLAKTGTLNEDADRFRAFAMALGVPAQAGPATALGCGLAVAAWFELSDDATPKQRRAALPSLHLTFANGPLVDVIARYWQQIPGCSARPAPAGSRGAGPAPRTDQ